MTDPEREETYDRFVRLNLKRNYAAHYLHGMLGMTGFRLINTPTFVPAYLYCLMPRSVSEHPSSSLGELCLRFLGLPRWRFESAFFR